ncbi:hypothetical protein Vadar_020918 [Vaccinium darrowii]|uniref:Uncharacterized protein n=1 Tax=Vaccinium darrowii TaxID=229202 RepID=A0ACB7X2H6_9ERIC|nr:hypothetical protein Vadar_020918 [Vaccinium darrowii]
MIDRLQDAQRKEERRKGLYAEAAQQRIELLGHNNLRSSTRRSSLTTLHGPMECLLNTIEACAISIWPDLNKHFSFIYCIEALTFKKRRHPYEKQQLDAELKLVGEYGLQCKRELWRVQYALSRIRNAARMLLTLDEKNQHRVFEGEALLNENQNKLD